MSEFLYRELSGLIKGKELGSGAGRTVFENLLDRTTVIKIEEEGKRFQNIQEWEFYQYFSFSDLSKWLAPCVEISGAGLFLIQKKTLPITIDQLPEKVPSIFTDLKPENWGLFEGRPVCHDYGYFLYGSSDVRMKKAKWHI